MAAGAAVDRERFGPVLARREMSVAAGDGKRPRRDVLAGRPSIIEEDEHHALSPQLDRRVPQPSRHVVASSARLWRSSSEMRSLRALSFTIRRAISSPQSEQGSVADFRPQTEQ
jgi:hypothetical protein